MDPGDRRDSPVFDELHKLPQQLIITGTAEVFLLDSGDRGNGNPLISFSFVWDPDHNHVDHHEDGQSYRGGSYRANGRARGFAPIFTAVCIVACMVVLLSVI
jgi:hypothetical protein